MSLSFGAPSSAPTTSSLSTGFSFGANATKRSTGFGTPQATTGLFGSPATSAPAFGIATPSFGTSLGSTGLNFGAGNNTTTTSTGLGFGAPISSATTTGLNLAAPASSAAPALGGFSFGTPAASSAPSLGFGLLGSAATTTAPGLFGAKLGAPAATTAQPATSVSVGLGGVASSGIGTASANTTSASGKVSEQQPKQQKLPNEISASVDAFCEFVRRQKTLAADVMRVSVKPLVKVSQQAAELTTQAVGARGEAGRTRAHGRRLRAAAAAALGAAERASRDTIDVEGSSGPPAYVLSLLEELEAQLVSVRRRADAAERHMQGAPRGLGEQELALGMRRMHESLVALAGRLQSAHAQVEECRRQYRKLLGDDTRVSGAELDGGAGAEAGARRRRAASDSLGSAVLDPHAALGSLQQSTGPTPFTHLGSSLSCFPAPDYSGASWAAGAQVGGAAGGAALQAPLVADPSPAFQLQKPPGKRGKQ